jgi:hypothetical protein
VRFQRIAGLCALGFVAVVIAANIARAAAGSAPAIDAAPDVITAYYLGDTTAFRIASVLPPLAWLLLAVFAAGAFARIRRVERERGEAWSIVGLVGIVCLIVIFAGVVATEIALTAAPSDSIWHLHHAYFHLTSIGIGVAMSGFAIGGLRTATLRPWHAYLGLTGAALVTVAAMLAPLTATTDNPALALFGLAGFLIWLIFDITFGVVLLRATPAPPPAIHHPSTSPSIA